MLGLCMRDQVVAVVLGAAGWAAVREVPLGQCCYRGRGAMEVRVELWRRQSEGDTGAQLWVCWQGRSLHAWA